MPLVCPAAVTKALHEAGIHFSDKAPPWTAGALGFER